MDSEILKNLVGEKDYKDREGRYNTLRSKSLTKEAADGAGIFEEEILLDKILKYANTVRASDVHIMAGAPPKFRIDGELEVMEAYPEIMSPADTRALLTPMLDADAIPIFDKEGDLDFSYSIKDTGRFRVNLYKQRGSWSAVFRLLSNKIPTPDELRMPEVIRGMIEHKRGLVLVTGPTGSGKSTTLASLIQEINRKYKRNVITLEDPIEYVHKNMKSNVAQREMGMDSKDFARALKAALREDPDVILVGEMRDPETIATAVTAAETGHLVFSTLHTMGAINTIDRIIDSYPENQQGQARNQLSLIIQGIISQALIPKATGKGRTAAFEIMTGTPAIRALIREGKTPQLTSVMQTSKAIGMQTLDDNLAQLVFSGQITAESALEFAIDPKNLSQRLNMTY